MEMEEITAVRNIHKEDEGTNEQIMETGEELQGHYSKLQNPSDDVYSDAFYDGSLLKTRPGNQTQGNVRLYAVCLFLSIICLVLLLVVIILGVKLQTGCGKIEETAAPNMPTAPFVRTCSFEQCQFSLSKAQFQNLGCQQCPNGWLPVDQSCFYLSRFRLSWDMSQKNCTARGGSLAVITSQRLQNFLTEKGNLKYWIGLRNQGATWTWVNNTVLKESYWADVESAGDCGILNSKIPPEKNWMQSPCNSYTYFICQLQF
ncbi:hypothetical protein PAMA_015282 [Pampus argenteus]